MTRNNEVPRRITALQCQDLLQLAIVDSVKRNAWKARHIAEHLRYSTFSTITNSAAQRLPIC